MGLSKKACIKIIGPSLLALMRNRCFLLMLDHSTPCETQGIETASLVSLGGGFVEVKCQQRSIAMLLLIVKSGFASWTIRISRVHMIPGQGNEEAKYQHYDMVGMLNVFAKYAQLQH